jgi:hypothetical protein
LCVREGGQSDIDSIPGSLGLVVAFVALGFLLVFVWVGRFALCIFFCDLRRVFS